ncbi:hypothetical protein ACWDA7_50680 [Streptomyces sp. NPDC001156]
MGAAETQRLRRRIDASQAEQVTEKAKAAGVVLEADPMARIDEVLQPFLDESFRTRSVVVGGQ